jgi:hypothetical protein
VEPKKRVNHLKISVMDSGWIKIHRRILQWEWYRDANTFRLFFHLLAKANHANSRWQGIDIEPGQVIVGRKSLAEELKLSEKQVRTSLNKLKTTNELTIKSTNRFSVVTICKWDDYQMGDNARRPAKRPTKGQSEGQQEATLKEGKELLKNISVIFEQFRKEYPGVKRGLKTELDNFLKKNTPETAKLLLPALIKEKEHKALLARKNEFVAPWKNLQTWVNNFCWENEFNDSPVTKNSGASKTGFVPAKGLQR